MGTSINPGFRGALLFVCVGNACRSQMAEGFARAFGPPDLAVFSAGSNPAGFVSQEAIQGMREIGIDISSHYSKGVGELPEIEFDTVVTMGCGDFCPTVGARRRIDWEIPDPIGRGIDFFQKIRDEIGRKVREILESK